MHKQDWIERVRRIVKPPLHGILSEFDLYAMGESGHHRYACTVYQSEDELEKRLVDAGFLRNPLAALKYRKEDGKKQISEGSWFFFEMEDPIKVAGVNLPKYQYHLTIYDADKEGALDCYIHKELWWGTDPSGHYAGDGVTPIPRWLRGKFADEGIGYRIEDTTQ